MALAVFAASADTYFTVKLGVDATKPRAPKPENYAGAVGFHVGPRVTFGLPSNFFLETGVSAAFHKWKYANITEATTPVTKEGEIVKNIFKSWSILVPVLAGYALPVGGENVFKITTGPQLNVGLSNKFRLTSEDPQLVVNADMYNNPMGMQYRRFVLDWNIGLAFMFVRHISFGVIMSYGLTNMAKNVYFKVSSFHTSLYVGYTF